MVRGWSKGLNLAKTGNERKAPHRVPNAVFSILNSGRETIASRSISPENPFN